MFSARRNRKIKVINGASVPFLLFLFGAKRLFVCMKYVSLITDFFFLWSECYIGALYLSKYGYKVNFFILYSNIFENIRDFGNYLMDITNNNLGK